MPKSRTPLQRIASRRHRTRRGLSLMEAMVSLAILGGSLAAIGELISLGARAAEDARDLTKAQLIADAIMNEINAKLVAPTSTSHTPCPMGAGFVYSVQVASSPIPDLLHIKLTIEREKDIAINNPRGVRYSLERILPDPNSQTFMPSYAAGSPEPATVDFSGAFTAGITGVLGGASSQTQGTGGGTTGQSQSGQGQTGQTGGGATGT